MSVSVRALAGLIFLAAAASASPVPIILTHQGRLLDGADVPVTGVVRMRWALYKNAQPPGLTDDETWWESNEVIVPVLGGLYSVQLGHPQSGTGAIPENVFDGEGERWLGITVEGQKMLPRFIITSVPWAMTARHADAATRADGAELADEATHAAAAHEADHAADATHADEADDADDAAKLGGLDANRYALKTDTAPNALSLGGTAAADYALKTDTAPNALALAGTAAASYALKTDTAPNALALGGTAAGDYALKIDTAPNALALGGTAAASYALKTDTAPNALALGGTAAASYALKTDTVANSSKLDDHLPSYFAAATHNHDSDYVRASGGGNLSLTGTGTFGMLALTGATGTPPTCDSNMLGRIYFDLDRKLFFGCDGLSWSGFGGTPIGLSQSRPGASCKEIHNQNSALPDGTYWIDPDGPTGGNAAFEAYCNMSIAGGGWTAIINLNTSDSTTRDYFDTTFWTGTGTVGSVAVVKIEDYKSQAFTDLASATEIMMLAHDQGAVKGTAVYSLLAAYQNKSLYWLFNNVSDTTITGTRTAGTGSVAGANSGQRTDGDAFIDHTHAVIINSRWQPLDAENYTRLGTSYSDRCGVIDCNGHNFGGWGGRHSRSGWGAYYEGAQLNGYCTSYGSFGTNGRGYNTNNAFYGGGCSGGKTDVDLMVFLR